MQKNSSNGSLADSQKARIEERLEMGSTAADLRDKASRAHSKPKRGAGEVDQNIDDLQITEEVAQPAKSDSAEVPSKKAKVSVGENETPQQSAAAENAEPAASAAPFSGGFGGLASKGASGFAFGGASTFGSGFGSVAFAGTFGSTVAGTTSIASKASKDGADKGSPSVASNAGSAAVPPAFGAPVFGSTSAAGATSERPVQVFGTANNNTPQNEAEEKPLTGEEEDDTVFSCKASLYHFDTSGDKKAWKERGVGLLRLNVLPGGSSRLVMRQNGILRLLLNACLYPEIALKHPEGQAQVSFSCANSASAQGGGVQAEGGQEGGAVPPMGQYTIKFGSAEKAREFAAMVERHKRPVQQSKDVTEAACAAVDAIAGAIV